jgi:hypothetical protein
MGPRRAAAIIQEIDRARWCNIADARPKICKKRLSSAVFLDPLAPSHLPLTGGSLQEASGPPSKHSALDRPHAGAAFLTAGWQSIKLAYDLFIVTEFDIPGGRPQNMLKDLMW